MRKFRNFRTAIFIIGILGVFMTFLISIAFKEKFYIEETSWNGNEKSTKSILLKENQVVEEEIVASHEMLYCFYIIIDESYKNFPEESLLNIKLCDKQNAVLFEYNFPLQMIDSNEHYIPNICSQQLVEKEVYTVILSPVNFGDAQIEVRAGDEGNLLLGTTYQVTDTSQLSIVRSIILICCIFLFVASILFQLLCKNVEKIRTIYDKKKKYILPLGLLIFLTVILLIYDGLLAAGILSGLLASGYCFGKWLEKYIFRIENSRWVTLALGIGGIGCIVYFVFEFGVGHSWVVGLILACPIFLNIKELKNFKWKMVGEKIADKINKNKGYAIWLCICLAIAVIFALSPIDDADAYWKHLPITIYASNNGQWYHNIIENVVAYSESTLLSYCFSVIFSIFGVVKGYVLFNVFLFGAIYFSLLQVLRGIYPKVRKGIFSAIFMTTPLFVMLGTSYMVDCLPVFFVSAILLNIVSLDWQTILDRLPQIAFICGLCVFSKLTILSTLCIFIIIIAGLVLKWLICEKISNVKKFQRVTVTMGKCIICFAIPFIYAFVNNYYRTGNPFSITAYNNIFKSPYTYQYPFSRPFADAEFSLATIDDIVFHTNEYIEMQPGGVGVFLLLGVLVPISWIFYKKVRYIVFSIIPVATYLLQGLIVGNLRYIWGAIALELGLIVISVSILLDCVKKVQVRSCGTVLICLSLTFPNIFYIYQNFSWRHMLAPNCEITECKNRKVLKSVPEGARVLSINDSQKGDYQGFYFELTWRNIYILNKIIEREYLLSDFVKGFDYVLYSKDTAFDLRTEAILRLFGEICDDKSLLEKVEETADHILYQVKNRGEKCIILEKGYEEGGQRLANGESLDFYIEEKWPGIQVEIEYQIEEDLYPYKNIPSNLKEETSLEEKYQLSEQLENLQKHTCELWMGVRWNDQSGQMLQYDNVENYCYSTQNSTVLGPIAGVEDAQSANISIKNVDDTEIVIKNIKILGNDTSSIIDEEIECYFSRQLLKQ